MSDEDENILQYSDWAVRRLAHGQSVELLDYGVYVGIKASKKLLMSSEDIFEPEQRAIIGIKLTKLYEDFNKTNATARTTTLKSPQSVA